MAALVEGRAIGAGEGKRQPAGVAGKVGGGCEGGKGEVDAERLVHLQLPKAIDPAFGGADFEQMVRRRPHSDKVVMPGFAYT